MKSSAIRETLRAIHVSPVKTLGQNFLHDRNLAKWIVNQGDLVPHDYVVEIGPGLGALTEFVLTTGAPVFGIEKDARLANFLCRKFQAKQFEIWHGDALKFDMRKFFAKRRAKLMGNLPYNIASQLLLKCLASPTPFSLVILMLQKEMADRLCAAPNTKNYGALTLQIQFHYDVKYLRKIPATVFVPAPDVDSALVSIRPKDPMETPACNFELFMRLVRRGFSERRKQLGKLLADFVPNWPDVSTAVGLDRQVRAEAVPFRQWVALTNQICPIPKSNREKLEEERFPVVDVHDEVLGEASRAEVHGNNFLHRAVHILIFNKAGEVYLQKRCRWKDRHPLAWDSSAAGHVNAGEDYDQAAKRELKEELGIEISLRKLLKVAATGRTCYEFMSLYVGRHEENFHLNLAEIELGAFFPTQIVDGWLSARPGDFSPGFAECWQAYRKTSR